MFASCEQQQQAVILQRRYRSAIALNNTGVRLLERNCYAQAIEILKDASILIKSILRTKPSSSTKLEPNQGGEEFVHRAMRAMAQPAPATKNVIHLDVLTMMQDGILVSGKGSETHSSSNTFLNSILDSVPCSSIAFPIRIEDHLLSDLECWSQDDLSCKTALVIQGASMWQNLGIAYLCQSKVAKGARKRLSQASVHFLRTSHAVLVKQNQHLLTLEERNGITLPTRTHEIPFMILPVMNALIHSFKDSSQHEKASKMTETLLRLRSLAVDLNNNPLSQARLGNASSAPAA